MYELNIKVLQFAKQLFFAIQYAELNLYAIGMLQQLLSNVHECGRIQLASINCLRVIT